MASALSDVVSVPPPASGTEMTSTVPPPNIAVVIGSRIAPWVAAASACMAAMAWPTRGPLRSSPVTTTSAGSGPPGNACWMASEGADHRHAVGSACSPGSSRCSESTGAASASSATVASPPSASGLRTTARTTAPHSRDGRAAARRRPRNGIRPRSVPLPSSDSSAGRNVSDPSTATPTTRMVPTATPENTSIPVRNSPASEIITVSPDTTIARPEVAAAIRSASLVVRPAARSSRTRRR